MFIIREYLKYITNLFRRDKTFSIVNVFGLSIAIAFTTLIIIYVHTESNVDNFHKNSDRIYRVVRAGECAFSPPFGQYIKDNIGGVGSFCRTFNIQSVFRYNENLLNSQHCFYADSSFFTMFSFPLLRGDPKKVLNDKRGVVVSESFAKRLFNGEDPVGKTIRFRNRLDLVVSGVMEDIKENTHFRQIDVLIPFHGIDAMFGEKYLEQFGNRFFLVGLYVMAENNVDLCRKGQELYNLARPWYWLFQEENSSDVEFQPLTDVYFNPASYGYPTGARSGNPRLLNLLKVASVCILFIAFINFMNLSITQAIKRYKEIGIKKINGASVWHIVLQTFVEVSTLCMFSIAVSIFILFLALPVFNNLSGYILSVNQLFQMNMVLKMFLLLIPVSIILGVVPSVILSGFNPLYITKKGVGKLRIGNVQKGLVIFQYSISTALIVIVIMIVKQNQFMRNYYVGFDKEETLYLRLNADIRNKYLSFKNELKKIADVENVSLCNSMPGIGIINYRFEKGNTTQNLDVFRIDEDFFDVFGIEIRNKVPFHENSCWITQSAAKSLQYNPSEIFIEINDYFNRRRLQVNEVLADINFHSLYEKPRPTIFTKVNLNNWVDYALVRINTSDVDGALKQIKKVYSGFSQNFPLEMAFIDDKINTAYEREFKTSRIVIWFSVLALIISSLGIFALAVYSINSRIKEIGIRKVNGAKRYEILGLLNMDFIKWVMAAFVVATPVSWIIVSEWLKNFAYQTGINWWVFVLAGTIAVFVAFITVTWISWQAARKNPVEALRYE